MCGIVGYVGPKSALDVLVGGLKRLEYRGYDSAGVSVISDNEILTRKKAGKLAVLTEELESSPLAEASIGIGHTRWATHGAPTDGNAHPHTAGAQQISLIHNGIIENFSEIKKELQAKGIEFESETDTEVAAQLLAHEYSKNNDFQKSFINVANRLQGAFTILAINKDDSDLVLAARRNSPLVIGVGDGENFLGSDVAAFVDFTKTAISVGQDQIVKLSRDGFELIDFAGKPVDYETFEVSWDATQASKGGWDSFMAKEISEEPQAVGDTLMGRLGEDGDVNLSEFAGLSIDDLASINRIIITACGTAAYAGEVAKYAIEELARVPVSVELAHELRYRNPVIDENTLVVAISQSGETMDTLMAIRYASERGAKILSICNTQGATLARESDATIYTHAGPEVAVASTKAFSAQITAGYLLALFLAKALGKTSKLSDIGKELLTLPRKVKKTLEMTGDVQTLANELKTVESVLFLGRNVGFPIAMEGALKLKELSYIHAEGFAAGELKHGPIALVEKGQVVIVIVPSPSAEESLHAKVLANIQEINARGAEVIAIAEEGDSEVADYAKKVFYTPKTLPLLSPVLSVVPLHIFSMELAKAKGLDVDQPRNLAKSVTVE
jgi:glucosamine--fructose-6-phosphate aminotransferase (isomerizing)